MLGTRRSLHPKPNLAERRSCPVTLARRRSWRKRSGKCQDVKKLTAKWRQMVSGDSRWILGLPLLHPVRKLKDQRGADPMQRLDVTRGREAIPSVDKRRARNAEPHTGGENGRRPFRDAQVEAEIYANTLRGWMDISGWEEGSHSEGDPKETPREDSGEGVLSSQEGPEERQQEIT